MFMGPLNFDGNQVSMTDLLPGHIHIAPIIFVDFSLANLTFQSRGTSEHSPNAAKSNQYRELLKMLCLDIHSNELFVPIFGYGARTFPGSSTTSNLFPMSLNLSNPLVPNQEDELMNQYATCLQRIKMDVPIKVAPSMIFLKNLAQMVRDKQEKRNTSYKTTLRFPQIFYQAFVLTTGIIDDINDLLKVFECSQWACLPV